MKERLWSGGRRIGLAGLGSWWFEVVILHAPNIRGEERRGKREGVSSQDTGALSSHRHLPHRASPLPAQMQEIRARRNAPQPQGHRMCPGAEFRGRT